MALSTTRILFQSFHQICYNWLCRSQNAKRPYFRETIASRRVATVTAPGSEPPQHTPPRRRTGNKCTRTGDIITCGGGGCCACYQRSATKLQLPLPRPPPAVPVAPADGAAGRQCRVGVGCIVLADPEDSGPRPAKNDSLYIYESRQHYG